MTVNARNQAAKYRPTLAGDRGLPWCGGCGQAPTYSADHELGRLVEHCRCGSRFVQTIGYYVPAPEPAPPTPRGHTQTPNHPWKSRARTR